MSSQVSEEEARRARYKRRIEEMRISKEKQMRRRRYIKKFFPFFAGGLVLLTAIVIITVTWSAPKEREDLAQTEIAENAAVLEAQTQAGGEAEEAEAAEAEEREEADERYQAVETEDTLQLGAYLDAQQEFFSDYAILIDLSDHHIIAEKYAKTRINPASMTKILTVLVAAEHLEESDLDDRFTMTLEITDYGYVHDCSSAGFADGERVTVRDLFYGTVLPSGADAAVGLAVYVAGSQEDFVVLMNEKLEQLGLSDTAHFTNCVGIYEEDHYCSVYDMAMIMEAAMNNEFCRQVLSAHTYTTTETEQHPEGIILSNWFLRRIEDKEGGENVLCAKTGYVVQSKNCAASYAADDQGNGYICVTAHAQTGWRCIYDHANLYKRYLS